ncbi:MAG: hypothetical protein ACLTEH_02400 [Clostridia bacterium]
MYTIEEFDNAKTKVLKYVLYKKRTVQEIKQKFSTAIENELLEEVIEELKQIGYVSDESYMQRAVVEFMALKNLSIKEIKYKLMAKGISSKLIEEYVTQNREELEAYEKKSAENIVIRKAINMEEMQIKQYLMKKGYLAESITEALEKLED